MGVIKRFIFLLGCLVVCMQSCSNNQSRKKIVDIKSEDFKDKLVDANKMYVKQESDEIDQYVKHKGWSMITTGTGVRYMVTREGNGTSIIPQKKVSINFNVRLLDGTLCYSSDSVGVRQFVVGMDNIETGLHEAIQYLHVGDKAVIILPSHLAYGLMGDGNKIPAKASVLYELEVLSLN